jgi:DNA-binding MarR family transcriptional regulator
MGATTFSAAALAAFLVLCTIGALFTSAAGPEGGAGGRAVIQVKTLNDLQNMGKQADADYELANDIDASATKNWNSGKGFAPLGTYDKPFTGTIDGKGRNITGLYINRPDEDQVGLVRVFYRPGGFLRYLNLIDVDITGGNTVGAFAGNNSQPMFWCRATGKVSGQSVVGGIAGSCMGGLISNCTFTGTVSGSGNYVGGLAASSGDLIDCYTAGTVTGGEQVGGLVGYNWKGHISASASSCAVSGTLCVGGLVGWASGTIDGCYSTGKVSGMGEVGGLVGNNTNGNGNQGTISDCFSTGAVSGQSRVGGFAGSNYFEPPEPHDSWGAEISRCYSTGAVSGMANIYGFLADKTGGNVTDCYWDTSTSGTESSRAGTGKATADMMKKATFTNWDFNSVWRIEENETYPYLRNLPAAPPNSAPVITTPPARTAAAGAVYQVQYHATDADGDALTWNMTSNASWLEMSASGMLSGTPSTADLGLYSVAITVSDGRKGTANQSFELEVSLNRQPLILSASAPENATVPADRARTFSVNASDPDGDSLTYDWQENGVTLGTESTLKRKFSPGFHSLILLIGDGHYVTTRTFNFTVAPAPDRPGPGPGALAGSGAAVAAGAVSVVFVAGFLAAWGTEVGKYKLLLWLFLPLYTRLRKDEVLDNETRGMIRGCVYSDPGVHYNEIVRRLNLKNGTAAHHLMTLEREGFVRSRNDGRLKRFYPAEMNPEEAPARLGRLERIIFESVREREGQSQREIARALDVPYPTVSRYVNKMAEDGVLRLEKSGINVRCYLADGAQAGEKALIWDGE